VRFLFKINSVYDGSQPRSIPERMRRRPGDGLVRRVVLPHGLGLHLSGYLRDRTSRQGQATISLLGQIGGAEGG